jgi:catechol 2,3-dioxygenase-like lactoylglutathione lyase family enzyme
MSQLRASIETFMIKTRGLTHINLAVKDPDRSLKFYAQVFGVKEYYRDDDSIQGWGRARTT